MLGGVWGSRSDRGLVFGIWAVRVYGLGISRRASGFEGLPLRFRDVLVDCGGVEGSVSLGLGPRVGPYSRFKGSGTLIRPTKTKQGTLFIPRLLLGLVVSCFP